MTVAYGMGYFDPNTCIRACCSVVTSSATFGKDARTLNNPFYPVIQNCINEGDKENMPAFQLCETDTTEAMDWSSSDQVLHLPPLNGSAHEIYANMVTCRSGHVTHCFLALDVSSSCWTHDDVINEGESLWQSTSLLSSCWSSMAAFPEKFVCWGSGDPLPYTLVCDHRQDCLDNSDEEFCVFPLCTGTTPLKCATSQQVRGMLTAAGRLAADLLS